MKTITEITEQYYLDETHTGGNCTALYGELNTNQDHILITDELNTPTDESKNFTIGVYLNGEHDEPAHIFETTNIEHLADLLKAIYELWGN